MSKKEFVADMLILIAILAMVGIACFSLSLNKTAESKESSNIVKTSKEQVQGHDYLFLHKNSCSFGVVHDPDCQKCNTLSNKDSVDTSKPNKQRRQEGSKQYIFMPTSSSSTTNH